MSKSVVKNAPMLDHIQHKKAYEAYFRRVDKDP